MALEPRTAAADDDNPELRDMTLRSRSPAVLTVPLLVQSMPRCSARRSRAAVATARTWLALALSDPGGRVGGRAVLRPRGALGRHAASSTCSR